MTEWAVRPAAEEDLPGVSAIRVRSWQVGYAGIIPAGALDTMTAEQDLVRRRELFATLGPEFASLVAAAPDGSLGGFANIGPYRGAGNRDVEEAPDEGRAGEIFALYVDPPRWRSGAGRALLAASVAWLTGRGRDPVRLWVLAANVRARRFYEAGGFAADGAEHTFDIAGAALPEVRYSFAGPAA
jgi:GNAT superfamily N-acetyltransferase